MRFLVSEVPLYGNSSAVGAYTVVNKVVCFVFIDHHVPSPLVDEFRCIGLAASPRVASDITAYEA